MGMDLSHPFSRDADCEKLDQGLRKARMRIGNLLW